MTNPLVEATANLLGILQPLSSEERRRLVHAVLVLLGDEPSAKSLDKTSTRKEPPEDGPDLPAQAKVWMQKHGLSIDTIGGFLHLEENQAAVIELPGISKSKRDRTQTCYLMAGLVPLLSSGESSFTDEQARALCLHFGCFDDTNHSRIVKQLGNKVTGSKATGWKLTAPGMSAVAALIKSKVTPADA